MRATTGPMHQSISQKWNCPFRSQSSSRRRRYRRRGRRCRGDRGRRPARRGLETRPSIRSGSPRRWARRPRLDSRRTPPSSAPRGKGCGAGTAASSRCPCGCCYATDSPRRRPSGSSRRGCAARRRSRTSDDRGRSLNGCDRSRAISPRCRSCWRGRWCSADDGARPPRRPRRAGCRRCSSRPAAAPTARGSRRDRATSAPRSGSSPPGRSRNPAAAAATPASAAARYSPPTRSRSSARSAGSSAAASSRSAPRSPWCSSAEVCISAAGPRKVSPWSRRAGSRSRAGCCRCHSRSVSARRGDPPVPAVADKAIGFSAKIKRIAPVRTKYIDIHSFYIFYSHNCYVVDRIKIFSYFWVSAFKQFTLGRSEIKLRVFFIY